MAGLGGADHMPSARNGRGVVNPHRFSCLRAWLLIQQRRHSSALGKFYLPGGRIGREDYTVLPAEEVGRELTCLLRGT